MANGTIVQVGNSTRIWELNLRWPLNSQCGVWDAKKPGVDVWQCIRARESRLSPLVTPRLTLHLQTNPGRVPNLPIKCIGNTLHVGSMEPHFVIPLHPHPERPIPSPVDSLILALGPLAGELTHNNHIATTIYHIPTVRLCLSGPFVTSRSSIERDSKSGGTCDKTYSTIAPHRAQNYWAIIVSVTISWRVLYKFSYS